MIAWAGAGSRISVGIDGADFDSEPLEAGRGEQGCVDLARLDLLEARFDIAAQRHDLEVGADTQQLRRPALRRGADDGALFELVDQVRADQPVADIAARADGGDVNFLGSDAFDVLHRMDAKAQLTSDQRLVELLGPQSLATDLGERFVENLVAGGGDCDQLDIAVGPALRGLDRRGDLARLGQSERRSASPELEPLHGAPLVHEARIRQRAGREMSCYWALNLPATTARRHWSPATGKSSRKRSSARTARTSRTAGWCRRSRRARMSRSFPASSGGCSTTPSCRSTTSTRSRRPPDRG